MRIQRPAQLTSRPRLRCQPIVIPPAGLPAQRPSPGHRPMTFQEASLEPGVSQWSISRASPPLRCHSIPSQQPIEMQNANLAWTTLKSGGYINRPGMTPDRIRLPTVREITSPDSASPHLLFSNPLPSPSLDRLLGNLWLIPQERQEKLEGRSLESSTRCRPPGSSHFGSLWTTSHGGGHPGARTFDGKLPARTLAAPQIALAQVPFPQTATESLLWSIPAQEALTTPRPLVWVGFYLL